MRCCPPRGLSPALQLFDSSVRDCFAALTGLHLDAAQWEQAARALSYAGLGLRSTTADAPAAFLASLGACLDTCRAIDPSYADAGLAVEVEVVEAVDALNRNRAAPLAAHLALGMKQKSLTAATDEASWVRQLASCSLTSRALLRSEAEPGARAFLAATPSGPKRIETALFVTELRQRLGVPDAAADAWCPKCDGVLDALSLHAATCSATMQFATCSAGGLSERACAQRRSAQGFFSHSALRRLAMLCGAPRMCTCPACGDLLLPLTWPLRPHSSRRLSPRRVTRHLRLPKPMLNTRRLTWTQLACASLKASSSFPWWWRAVMHGSRLRAKYSCRYPAPRLRAQALTPLSFTPICCKNFV